MNKKINRRKFVVQTGKACLASALIAQPLQLLATKNNKPEHPLFLQTEIGWSQTPLPYSLDALEPVIDAKTMEIHYSRHAAGYAKVLGEAVKAEHVDPSTTTLENLLAMISGYSTSLRNNAGGHYNHELFWKTLRAPKEGNQPSSLLLDHIIKKYSSFESFKATFTEAAMGRFGSGWAWLTCTREKALEISTTPNQDNPLMEKKGPDKHILLGLDVWEHAYYLKYQNRRKEYVTNWWTLINWEYVERRFSQI